MARRQRRLEVSAIVHTRTKLISSANGAPAPYLADYRCRSGVLFPKPTVDYSMRNLTER